MGIWREDVVQGLKHLGGEAHLDEIYLAVKKIRTEPLPASWRAIIRRELEYNSSDTQSYTGKYDLFYSVKGLGEGHWGLRKR